MSKKRNMASCWNKFSQVRPSQHGETIMVKEFEQDFVDDELSKRKDLTVMKSSTNEMIHAGSAAIVLFKKKRKGLKDGVRNPIAHYSCKEGSNIGTTKFVFKVKGNKDEEIKLTGTSSCEENKTKLTTRFCKRKVRSAIKMFSKSRFKSTDSKASCLMKVLTD